VGGADGWRPALPGTGDPGNPRAGLGTGRDPASFARAEGLSAAEDPAIRWVLLRGVFGDDEVMNFDSRYQTTGIPSEYLWGPGTASDAVRWLDIYWPTPDQVDPVDQLMLVRHHGDKLYLPQRPEIAAAMPPSDQTGRWYLLLADHPWTAFACVRAVVDRDPGHRGPCRCAPRRLGHGGWRRVQAKVMELRPDLARGALRGAVGDSTLVSITSVPARSWWLSAADSTSRPQGHCGLRLPHFSTAAAWILSASIFGRWTCSTLPPSVLSSRLSASATTLASSCG
jgi:hypothetical protein